MDRNAFHIIVFIFCVHENLYNTSIVGEMPLSICSISFKSHEKSLTLPFFKINFSDNIFSESLKSSDLMMYRFKTITNYKIKNQRRTEKMLLFSKFHNSLLSNFHKSSRSLYSEKYLLYLYCM